MQSNAFSLIFVSPVRSRDSDSTDYLYSPCSTASVYHFFISVIKRLFCCGLQGLFSWNHYTAFLIIAQVTMILAYTPQPMSFITCLSFLLRFIEGFESCLICWKETRVLIRCYHVLLFGHGTFLVAMVTTYRICF